MTTCDRPGAALPSGALRLDVSAESRLAATARVGASFADRIWPVIDVYDRVRRLADLEDCSDGRVRLLALRRAAIA